MEEPVETIRALRRVAASELSLDAPIDRSDRDSASFGERFAGAEASDIEVDVEAIARRDFLEDMFERYLTERERKILYLYYGLDDGEERTLEEIGSLLGVTRERIRQIRNRGVREASREPSWRVSFGLLERQLTLSRDSRPRARPHPLSPGGAVCVLGL